MKIIYEIKNDTFRDKDVSANDFLPDLQSRGLIKHSQIFHQKKLELCIYAKESAPYFLQNTLRHQYVTICWARPWVVDVTVLEYAEFECVTFKAVGHDDRRLVR